MNTNKTPIRLTLKAQVNLNNLFFSFEKVTFKNPSEELNFFEQKLNDAEYLHELMNEVNGTYLAFIESPKYLEESNLSTIWKNLIRNYIPTRFELLPFASYVIAYNNERVKGYRLKVKFLEDMKWIDFFNRNRFY